MRRKTAVRIFQATNWRSFPQDDVDVATERKPYDRN